MHTRELILDGAEYTGNMEERNYSLFALRPRGMCDRFAIQVVLLHGALQFKSLARATSWEE